MSGDFVWRDAGRVVVCRRGGIEAAPQLLREHGFGSYEVVSTPRALVSAPELEAAAAAVHAPPPGQVPEAAAALLGRARAPALVALGGGRTIDTAKAVASVTGARVAALPTTLSGAEMTGIHRLPAGAENRVQAMTRPQLAIADPHAMTTQAEPALRASAMNGLAHGGDSLYTPFANPVSQMTALRGAELISAALDEERATRNVGSLAQGALLCGYAIDSAAFGIHHVVCQTLVRTCGIPHAETNAAVLPHALTYLAGAAPDGLAGFAEAIDARPGDVGSRVRALGGDPAGLGDLGAERSELEPALDSMMARPELAFTPGPPTRSDLQAVVEAAW